MGWLSWVQRQGTALGAAWGQAALLGDREQLGVHRHRTLQPPQHSLQSEEMRGVVHMKLLGAAGVATNPWGCRAPPGAPLHPQRQRCGDIPGTFGAL